MAAKKSAEIIQVNLRLPANLRRRLAQEAKKARRSLNQEMVLRLEQTFRREAADVMLQRAKVAQARARMLYDAMGEVLGITGPRGIESKVIDIDPLPAADPALSLEDDK
jgi:hypothetical protein